MGYLRPHIWRWGIRSKRVPASPIAERCSLTHPILILLCRSSHSMAHGPAGHGLLAATGSKLADFEAARTDVQRALDLRPDYDVRCRALDTIVLATILINAGELRDGISETRRALHLVTTVGSQRVRDRLEPLEQSLSARRDSTCQDLAQQVHSLRMPRVGTAT